MMHAARVSALRQRSIHLIVAIAVGVSILWSFSASAMAPKGKDRAPRCEAMFSPGGGIESRLAEEIGAAKKRIRVQMYIFNSKRIGEALSQTARRGVNVEVILDKSQEKATYGPWRVMRRDGVKIYFDSEHETANNKVILIDDRTVITGSYNFTKAAEEKNAENILIVKDDRSLFDAYNQNFEAHLEHARKAAS